MPKSRRRFLRIGLRTLFVVMTVCAVWIGFRAKRALDQRAAVARIHQLGGAVVYDYQDPVTRSQRGLPMLKSRALLNLPPPGWPWLRRLIGDEYFQEVVYVALPGSDVDDDDLQLVARLQEIHSLDLNSVKITDAGVRHLASLRRLAYLTLANTQVSGEGMRALRNCRDLESLVLEGVAAIDDRALAHIGSLSNLTDLNLDRTSVTSAGLKHLTRLEKLQFLGLNYTAVDDDVVSDLGLLRNLAMLGLSQTRVSGLGLLAIRDQLPSCELNAEIFDLAGSKTFNSKNSGRRWLALVSRMKALVTEGRLKAVVLSDTALADDDLTQLFDLDSIAVIDLRRTRVTSTGVDRLKRELPGTIIVDAD